MAVKDYYKILELSPQATHSEVKKNFRRLALRYHPDINQGNRYAEAWYHEIQEAYETLTNTKLREAYHQQRWLLKSQGKSFAASAPLTPHFILMQVNELHQQVKNMDHFRMNHHLLQQQILNSLSDEHIEVLHSYNDSSINRQVLVITIDSTLPLEFQLLHAVIKQLQKLTVKDKMNSLTIDRYYQKRKKQNAWERYQGMIILAITALLCLGIYFLGK